MLLNEFKLLTIGVMCLPGILLADGPSCADYEKSVGHTYHPLKHCQKSNKTVVGSINVNTVDKCAEFAAKRKAMAFNFAQSDRGNINLFHKLKGLGDLEIQSANRFDDNFSIYSGRTHQV